MQPTKLKSLDFNLELTENRFYKQNLRRSLFVNLVHKKIHQGVEKMNNNKFGSKR